ncbi:MAG: glycosyltransferase family 4 protein [Candidatus Nitrosocaldaceae archaeon]
MNILWLNWKDIKHPEAGGAEVFTHEVAKRLVKDGYNITLFTSLFDGVSEEVIDDINIVRRGSKLSVYKEAARYYKENKERFDLVIDEINTKPFLTPKYVNSPKVALIHQLAREYWFYEVRFPINVLGYYILENLWLKNYLNIPTIVPSQSTKDDLVRLGFKDIRVVKQGLSIEPLANIPAKDDRPTLLFTARLKRVKRPLDAIKAFKLVKEKIKDAQLWIVGDGYMFDEIKRYEDDSIKVYGKVSHEMKIRLMSRAHILLAPFVREGWGLVVTEANALGTIAVSYDIPGLRDSIIDGITGKLVRSGDINGLVDVSIELLKDENRRREYAMNALEYAKQFNWNRTAKEFIDVLEGNINRV